MKLKKRYSDVSDEEVAFLRSKKLRYVTFSSDDSVMQDAPFMDLLDKYGALCTFNINTALLGDLGTIAYNGHEFRHDKVSKDAIRNGFYRDHEVACHTLHHPSLPRLNYEDQMTEIAQDAENILELTGTDPVGIAYPGGGYDRNEDTYKVLANTRLKYARTIEGTGDFNMPKRFYEWHPTMWEWDDALIPMTQRFLNCDISEESKVFYIWGHAYEIDFFPYKIPALEESLKMLAADDSVVFVTNRVLYKLYCDRIKSL